jgi:hypothetical protein
MGDNITSIKVFIFVLFAIIFLFRHNKSAQTISIIQILFVKQINNLDGQLSSFLRFLVDFLEIHGSSKPLFQTLYTMRDFSQKGKQKRFFQIYHYNPPRHSSSVLAEPKLARLESMK